MRIALIGDLQYSAAERPFVAGEMERIASLRPDYAVFLGDHAGQRLGRLGGLLDLKSQMERLGCPYHALLGNHDVECAPGGYFDDAPSADYRSVFGRDPWRAEVMDGVLFVFVSVERQPRELMRTVNGVYVGDWQFRWLEDQLRAHAGVPTLIFSHAHAAGAGIRVAPPLHCAAADTYLDQTYDALRWRELPRRFPQIRAWFSAHLHMGHDYDTAISERGGTTHVSCGVFVEGSRDSKHHTRFIETDCDALRVLTLDHDLSGTALTKDALIDLSGKSAASGRVARVPEGEMLLGDDGVRWVRRVTAPFAGGGAERGDRCGSSPLSGAGAGRGERCTGYERYFVATEKGLLWEYDSALADFCGALLLRGGCVDLRFDGERIYVETDRGERFSLGAGDRDRFDRIGSFTPQARRTETELRGAAAQDVPFTTRSSKEGLWVRF